VVEGACILRVNPPLSDDALNALFQAAWPAHRARTFDAVLRRSLAWVGAFAGDRLVGFVNLAWDGGHHAFILDTTVHPACQRQGIGRALVLAAADVARAQGVTWLHVDYAPHLHAFYARCGFRETAAGLLHLSPEGAERLA
jgi:GNAT superfamily N-acetyltransferase